MHPDLLDLSAVESRLSGFDASFFCLGVSSAGMKEEDYRRVTFDITLAAAQMLARLNPTMTFIYVSGAGTDGSERGRTMWARVKGQTENALLRLPFKAVMFRPGGIVPLHGITSKTWVYRVAYALTRPLWSMLLGAFPQYVTTTEQVGRAMLRVAKQGAPKPILETRDINALRQLGGHGTRSASGRGSGRGQVREARRRPTSPMMSVRGNSTAGRRALIFEDERHLHVHPELRDLPALDLHLLLLDPGALDVLQSHFRARDPDAKGVFEALRGRGRDLRDFCDCHSLLAPLCLRIRF